MTNTQEKIETLKNIRAKYRAKSAQEQLLDLHFETAEEKTHRVSGLKQGKLFDDTPFRVAVKNSHCR